MARPFEFYETPPGVTEALMIALGSMIEPGHSILDPCVGEAAILEVIKAMAPGAHLISNDLNPERPAAWHLDATEEESWHRIADLHRIDWVITNPPFSQAHLIIPHAVRFAVNGVAMLLPLRFLEPTKERVEVLNRHRWQGELILGSPRPSFTEDGRTDSVTTFWAIWIRGKEGALTRMYVTAPETRWQTLKTEDMLMV